MPEYIDSHSHLAQAQFDADLKQVLQLARSKGIVYHLQGGIGPDDWSKQFALRQMFPEILPVVGLHPYWISEHSDAECEAALSLLPQLAPRAYAIGELGLDFRTKWLAGNGNEQKEKQIDYFRLQLEIAQVAQKPVVLHIVQAFAEAVQVIELVGLPLVGGLVHSFNGSEEQAKKYLQLGLHLSIGGPVTKINNHKLHKAIEIIPMDRLLLETDSPDQPPDSIKGQRNTPMTLLEVAQKISQLKKISAEEVLDRSSQNLRKLIRL